MSRNLKTFATVTLIALLVWLYAEGATRKQRTVVVNVQFVGSAGQQNLLILSDVQQVTITVRAATSQLVRLDELKRTTIELPVTYDPSNLRQRRVLAPMLAEHEAIQRLGVGLEGVQPEIAEVYVEKLESRPMRIVFDPPKDLELSKPAVIVPEQGTVTVPASRVNEITDEYHLLARLTDNALAGVEPGVEEQNRPVDVSLPPDMAGWSHVEFAPKKVKVTFTVKVREQQFVVDNIPVRLSLAPTVAATQLKQYAIDVKADDLVIRDLKIRGPNATIERIKTGVIKLEGSLRLEPADLDNLIESKRPELNLPPGVIIVEESLPLIKLKITKRSAIGG